MKRNISEVINDAIQRKDIAAAKALLTEPERTDFTYRKWTIFLEDEVIDLEDNLRNDFRSVLLDLAGEKIRTYLRTALQNLEDEPVAVLILKRRPELFLVKLDKGDIPFHLAVSNGKAQVVTMFLQYVQEINQRYLVSPEISGPSQPEKRAFQHSAILEKAAERGHLEVVKILAQFDPKLLGSGYPLHKAVRGGHVEIVEFLLQEKPGLVEKFTPEPHPRSALFEDRSLGKEDETSLKIDKLLVARIIRGGEPGKSPRMIRKLLQEPQGNQHYS